MIIKIGKAVDKFHLFKSSYTITNCIGSLNGQEVENLII